MVTATGRDVVGAYLVFAFLLASLILTGIPLDASSVGEDVKDGHSVDGVRVTEKLPLIGNLPVIDVRATVADVYWKSDAKPAKLPTGCLLYLGRNEGQALFYFVPRKGTGGGRVVRIPSDDFVMSLRTKESCKTVLSKLSLKPSTFRAARSGASVAREQRGPIGTTVSYRLSADTTVAIGVERAREGRRRGGKCRKPSRRARGKRCTRYVRLRGSFNIGGTTGLNRFEFTGRMSNRRLTRGTYRLVARPSAAEKRGRTVRASFRIRG